MPDVDYYEQMNRLANSIQIMTFLMTSETVSNTEISKKLDMQDNIFLIQIIRNQEKILNLLEEISQSIKGLKE